MKYIDAERLKAGIESFCLFPQISADYNDGREDMKMVVLDIIDSLQQEQQDKKEVKFVFPKFLYARTTNNKTIDVSYAPQSLDAVEYIRSDSLQQEQPEVDLDEEIYFWIRGGGLRYPISNKEENNIKDTAIRFYELGLNTKKEKQP